MPSGHVNTTALKECLLDAVDIGKESRSDPLFPFVALTLAVDTAQAYGRSRHAVGWSFTDRILLADESNTILISLDEAKELGMAVGKTSAAKEATVWVEIEHNRLSVSYGEESLADLPGIEPEPGDIESVNEEMAILESTTPAPRPFFAMGIETIKRFTKVRGKTPYMDMMFTDIGNTTFVKIGDTFIGGFEAIARDRIVDPKLFQQGENT